MNAPTTANHTLNLGHNPFGPPPFHLIAVPAANHTTTAIEHAPACQPHIVKIGGAYRNTHLNKDVLLVGVHPHDGACLICEVYNEHDDTFILFECEASDLKLPAVDPVTVKLGRRADGMPRQPEIRHLRRLLASFSGVPHLYSGDGEASGYIFGTPVDFMRDTVHDLETKLTNAALVKYMEPVEGDLLPHVGEEVLFHHGSEDKWVKYTVLGFYVWFGHGEKGRFRINVRGITPEGHQNARSLGDVRRLDGSNFV